MNKYYFSFGWHKGSHYGFDSAVLEFNRQFTERNIEFILEKLAECLYSEYEIIVDVKNIKLLGAIKLDE